MTDRAEFDAARQHGLVKRHETRVPWNASLTYPPDATECRQGHPFASEADCVLPDGWDNFMCRTCINIALAEDPLPAEEAPE